MKRLSLLVFCFYLLVSSVSAQEVTIFGEGVMPTGRYAKSMLITSSEGYYPLTAITDVDNALGGAGWGWGTGVELAYASGRENLDLLFEVGFRMNWTNKMMQDYFADYARDNHSEGITRAPLYLNIPLMFGPRYSFPITDGFSFYVAGELGLNIRIITEASYTANLFVDYRTAGTLAFRGSAGFLLFDHIRLEANWSWMGDDLVKATLYDGKTHDMGGYGYLETMQLGLRLGYTF